MTERLNELRRELIAGGKITSEGVAKLRAAMFDEEGMTKEKGEFLFDIKNTINKKRITPEFKDLFVEAITSLLLDDEDSPGEIDDSEAKWLRAKIQSKGYFDFVDEEVLRNIKRKAINFPSILNYKNKLVRTFESGLYFSRFLAILAVIGASLSAVALFVKGTVVVFVGLKQFICNFNFSSTSDYEGLIEVFVSSVDIYLFSMVLVIFGMGIYELFISKIDPVEASSDDRPSWLQVKSIDDLKSSLGKVILMVLIVSFFKHALVAQYKTVTDLLMLAVGVVLISLALYIAHAGHGHKKD